MKNKRKIIKNCIIIILIILSILVLKDIFRAASYFCFSDDFKLVFRDNDKELDKSDPMTVEEVTALLEKGSNYNNYVITRKFKQRKDGAIYHKEEHENKIYVKDNTVSSVTDGKNDYWMNYDENLYIMNNNFVDTLLIPIDKFLYYEGVHRQKATDYTSFFTGYSIVSYHPHEGIFEYLGEKNINGRRTIVTKTTAVRDYEKYYIDKETGVIVNKEQFQYNHRWIVNSIIELSFMCKTINYGPAPYDTSGYNFSVEFDCVTDEDVKKPNYAGRLVYNAFYEEDEERKYNRIM